jgi:hypothetical protein
MSGTLAHTPAHIIRQLLIDLGLGADGGATWPVYYTLFPDAQDNQLGVFNTEGRTQGKAHVIGQTVEKYGIQIRIRGMDETVGLVKAHSIDAALSPITRQSVTVDATAYLVQALTRTSSILGLGRESPSSARRMFSINYLVSLRTV